MNSSSTDIIERLERAEQLKIAGAHQEALVLLENLLIEDPENVPALEEIADNELSLEHYDRAATAAKQAIELDDHSYTGHYILGFLESQKNNWETAVEHFRKANKMKGNNAEILRCLGWSLFNAGQRAQGIVTLERSVNIDTENALAVCDLGVAYLQTHHTTKAKTLFQRALELDPANKRIQECVQALERYQQAAKSVE